MPTNFKITMDNQVFSIATPVPPENEFVKYRQSLSLYDDALFEKSNYVTGLQVHWKYRSGLLRKVAGVMELKVILQAAREHDVTSEDGLRQELLADFRRELTKVGYKGTPVPFEKVTINGRSWLKYQVPVLGVIEHSTGLSNKRLLIVRFGFIDNTSEKSPAWHQEAKELMTKLLESARVE